MKKLLLCTLTLLLLCAGALAAQETQREGDFLYAVREDGTAEIVAYLHTSSYMNFTYPAELGGLPVTRIALDPMQGMPHAESVTIPDSVVELGSCPLADADLNEIIVSPDHPVFAVEGDMLIRKADRCLVAYASGHANGTVEIPADVTDVTDGVFAFCQSAAFAVPENHQTLTVINSALYSKADHRLIAYPRAADVPSVAVAAGTEVIGDYAFLCCFGLTEITLPDSVTSIGDYAFVLCSGLTSITLPDSVTNIGDWAFYYCKGLTSITLPDSVTSIGERTFYNCSGLTSITLPDSVTSIGDNAFAHCSGLTSITIPNSVTSIGDGAFKGCDNLSLTVVRGSYAETYARERGIPYTYTDAMD